MKKIAIITIIGNENFGNRLQNYAVFKKLTDLKFNAETIWKKEVFLHKVLKKCKRIIIAVLVPIIKKLKVIEMFYKREKVFKIFTDKYINNNYYRVNIKNKINNTYDYVVIGSDQIWNPNVIKLIPFGLEKYIPKTIAFSASFGVDIIREKNKYKNSLEKIDNISVREERGKEMVEELTGRTDVEVLVDPTMLLTAEEWDKVSKKPEQLKSKKYILNYFLGNLSESRKKEIERVAKENECEIINILDPNDPLYVSGPSEFLYLEKNAFLICTDSFHSSVFAILYNRPFVVFDREQSGVENMGSRIDTLINKFKLQNRRFEGKITKENLEHDYTEAYKLLEEERKKSDKFLKKALEIEENEN